MTRQRLNFHNSKFWFIMMDICPLEHCGYHSYKHEDLNGGGEGGELVFIKYSLPPTTVDTLVTGMPSRTGNGLGGKECDGRDRLRPHHSGKMSNLSFILVQKNLYGSPQDLL